MAGGVRLRPAEPHGAIVAPQRRVHPLHQFISGAGVVDGHQRQPGQPRLQPVGVDRRLPLGVRRHDDERQAALRVEQQLGGELLRRFRRNPQRGGGKPAGAAPALEFRQQIQRQPGRPGQQLRRRNSPIVQKPRPHFQRYRGRRAAGGCQLDFDG